MTSSSSRLTNVFFVFLGAAALALVLAALSAVGVIQTGDDEDRQTTVVREVPGESSAGGDDEDRAPAQVSGLTDVSELVERVTPGVVFVQAAGRSGGGSGSPFGSPDDRGGGGDATGSGFVTDDRGTIVTNQHVIDGASTVKVRFGEEGQAVDAKVVGADPSTDLAVLRVDPADVKGGVKPLKLGSSKNLKPGEPTIAIGAPFGLSGTVTTGIVSALDRTIEAPNNFSIEGVVQTDAAINPGNSGGPLLDASGRVIGVNSQIATSSQSNSGVGFAVPVDTVKDVVPRLQKDGEIKRAYLGVQTVDPKDVQDKVSVPVDEGAIVAAVTPGGPASKAGFVGADKLGGNRVGDVITAIDGKPIKSPDDVSEAIEDNVPGDTIKVQVRNGTKTATRTVTLDERPKDANAGG